MDVLNHLPLLNHPPPHIHIHIYTLSYASAYTYSLHTHIHTYTYCSKCVQREIDKRPRFNIAAELGKASYHRLFTAICSDHNHALRSLFPALFHSSYDLRQRPPGFRLHFPITMTKISFLEFYSTMHIDNNLLLAIAMIPN